MNISSIFPFILILLFFSCGNEKKSSNLKSDNVVFENENISFEYPSDFQIENDYTTEEGTQTLNLFPKENNSSESITVMFVNMDVELDELMTLILKSYSLEPDISNLINSDFKDTQLNNVPARSTDLKFQLLNRPKDGKIIVANYNQVAVSFISFKDLESMDNSAITTIQKTFKLK